MRSFFFTFAVIFYQGLVLAQTAQELTLPAVQSLSIDQDGSVPAGNGIFSIGETADESGRRGFLSFDLSSLPEDARVLAARLQIHVSQTSGNPSALGALRIDMNNGPFSGALTFQAEDFDAQSGLSRAALAVGTQTPHAVFDARALRSFTQTGTLCFRIYFDQNDHADGMVDRLECHGSSAAANLQPTLFLTYSTDGAVLDPITLTLDPLPAVTTASDHTISGSVSPVDALVLFGGTPVTVDEDGAFAFQQTLHAGANDLLFLGLAYPFAETRATVTSLLDTFGPVIVVTTPGNNHHTNEGEVSISGRVDDQLDREPVLTRDGNVIPLNNGRFLERDLPLSNGTHTFTYQAVDAAGNTAAPFTVTVHQNDVPPVIQINAPDHVGAGQMFDLEVSFSPADKISEVQVSSANEFVHQQKNGTPIHIPLQAIQSGQHDIRVQARDLYGNIAESEHHIIIGDAHFLQGRFLDNRNSLPLAGVSFQISTPLEQRTLTSDGQGRFEAYLEGSPVSLTVSHPGYLTTYRHRAADTTGMPLDDIRLTATADTAPGRHEGNGFAMTHGLGAAMVRVDAQGLPALLPLGFSPIIAASVPTGEVAFSSDRPALPTGARLALLQQEEGGWRVRAWDTYSSGTFNRTASVTETGVWMLALADPNLENVPLTGDLLLRKSYQPVPLGQVRGTTIDPATVSVLDTPQTTLHVSLTAGALPAGTTTRVRINEFHQHFNQSFSAPQDEVTLFAYRTPIQFEDNRLNASAEFHTRETVDPDLTISAEMMFQPIDAPRFTPQFPENQIFRFGVLTLDFNGTSPEPHAMDVHPLLAGGRPMAQRSTEVAAFSFWIGGQLDRAPKLTYSGPVTGSSMVLLQRFNQNQWAFVCLLRPNGEVWENNVAETNMKGSGDFMLVSLIDPITEITGEVRDGGQPVFGAVVSGDRHPWYALSGQTGAYRFFTPQSLMALTLTALDPVSQKTAQIEHGATEGEAVLTNQDFSLAHPGFALLYHEPGAGERFAELFPKMLLGFNQPLTLDQNNIQNAIRLEGPGGAPIGLAIVQDRDQQALSITPDQSLQPQTEYTVRISAQLETLYGAKFSEPAAFSFFTRDNQVSEDLELSRFYLTEESGHLVINGPEGSFPQGTRLNAINEATAASLSWILNGPSFSGPISGRAGHVINLEATAPDGTRLTNRTDVVRLGEDSWRLGIGGFSLEWEDGTRLHLDEIQNGQGKEVSITVVDNETVMESLNKVETLGDIASRAVPLRAIKIATNDGSEVPTISGRLSVTGLPDPGPGYTAHVMQLNEVVMPVHPDRPEDLAAFTLAGLLNSQSLAEENENLKRHGKYSLLDISMSFGAYSGDAYDSSTISAMGVPHGDVMVKGTVHVFRPHNLYPGPDVEIDGEVFTGVPAQVYTSGAITQGIPTPVSTTDKSGTGYFVMTGSGGSIQARDPVTGETKRGSKVRNSFVEVFGEVLWGNRTDHIEFTKTIDGASFNLPRLGVYIQGGKVVDGQFEETERAEQELPYNMVTYESGLQLRVVLASDDELPAAELLCARLPQNLKGTPLGGESIPGSDLPGRFSFLIPSSALNAPGRLAFTINAIEDTGEEPPTADDMIGSVSRALNVYTPGAALGDSMPGPPMVTQHFPKRNSTGLPSDLHPVLTFNEPVTGLASGVRLYDASGRQISTEVFAGSPIPLTDDGHAVSITVHPKFPLHFGEKYTLEADPSIKDLDGNGLSMGGGDGDTFELKFTIQNVVQGQYLNEGFGQVGTLRYRNLMLVYQGETEGIREFNLDLYDLRSQKAKPLYRTAYPLKGLLTDQPLMALVTPKDLSSGNRILDPANDSAHPLSDIPRESILMIFGTTHHSLNYLQLYEYLGSGRWEYVFKGHPAPGGVLRNLSSLGPYLAMPFSAANLSNSEILDLRDYLEKIEDTQLEYDSGDINQSNYFRRLNILPFVTGFPIPKSTYDAELFLRNAGTDDRPTFITSGVEGPAMYEFTPGDPSLLPNRADRLLAPVLWPDGEPGHDRWVGHAKNLRFKISGEDVFGDVALFSRQIGTGDQANGNLLIYRVPAVKSGAAEPLAEVIFPNGLPRMAVDSISGLVAVVSGEDRLNVLSIRQLIEETHAAGGTLTMSPANQDLYLFRPGDEPTVNFKRMDFVNGIVSGVEKNHSYNVRVIPVVPKPYRVAGFEYYALNDWMSAREDGAEANTPLSLERADTMVYYAQDLVSGSDSGFVMEMGTFDLDLRSGEKAEVTIREIGGGDLKVYSRPEANGNTLETYNLNLAGYFTAEVQQRLRRKGVLFFEVAYEISQGQVPVISKTHTFAVSYLPPQSFGDSGRFANGIDLLTGRPNYLVDDFAFSQGDPRNDLSIGRAYTGTSALEFGAFGAGMVDTRALHMAMPVWWNPEEIQGKDYTNQIDRQEVHFQHPGVFESRMLVEQDAHSMYGLNQKFEKEDDHWVFTMGDQFKYTFAFDTDLPDFRDLFRNENRSFKDQPDSYDRIRYPVLRKRPEGKVPPTFMGTVLMASQEDHWGNHLKFEKAGKPAMVPDTVTQKVNDLGGERAVHQRITRLENGRVVEEIPATNQNPGVLYRYDDDGYLTEVTQQGRRARHYQWEAVEDFSLGDLPVKRLVRVSQEDEFTEFSYHQDRPFAVASIENPLGIYTMTQTLDNSGLVSKAEISALGPVPGGSVTFSKVDGHPMTTSYQTGTKSFTRTWERIAGDGLDFAMAVVADTFLNQSWNYDGKGRVLNYTNFDRTTSFKYENGEPFEFVPTEKTDPVGNVFVITTTKDGQTIENGDHKETLEFSGSGEIKRVLDLYGRWDFAGNTTFYIPSGGSYRQRNGRLVQILNPDYSPGREYTFNAYGEVIRRADQGVVSLISQYDDLGRPGMVETGGMPARNLSYLFKSQNSATYRVTRVDYDGLDKWEETWVDDSGRVGFEISHLAGATHTTAYTYDDLSRLIEVQLDGSPIKTLAYLGDSNFPTSSVGLGRDVAFDRAPDGRLNSVDTTIGGVTHHETVTTDLNGQIVSYRMFGQGMVTNQYNGFGLVEKVNKLGAAGKSGETLIEYTHGRYSVTEENHITHITSVNSFTPDGRGSGHLEYGPGRDVATIMAQFTKVHPNEGNFGHTFETVTLGLPEEYIVKRNAAGYLTAQEYGSFQVHESGQPTVYGQPRQMAGTVTSSFEFDAYGRLTGLVNRHGDSESYSYDSLGRGASATNRRASNIDFEYFPNSTDLKSVAKDGPNVQGLDKYKIMERENLANQSDRSWLGNETKFKTISENETLIIRKDKQGALKGLPEKVEKDPETGRITRMTNHEGEVTQFYYDDGQFATTIDAPGKQLVKVIYDGLGNARKISKGQVELLDIKRDRFQRYLNVKTQDHHYDYRYEGDNLIAVLGGKDDIHLGDHTELGMPRLVTIGNHTQIEITYHPGGRPKWFSYQTSHGLPSTYTYNTLGDLVTIQRGMQPPVHLTYNQHGAVDTVQVGDTPVSKLFDGGDPGSLQLPGGVGLTLTGTGKIESVFHPGLVPKTYQYDALDRVSGVLLDNVVQETFAYEAGNLKSRASEDADHPETQTFSYDGRHRLESTDSDLDGASTFTYHGDGDGNGPVPNDFDLVKTYTDANGVTYHYEYDQRGRTTSIQLEDGPTFHYTWNEAGQQTSVSVAGMSATFGNYRNHQPTELTWVDPLSGVTVFTREFDERNLLTNVRGGDFELRLRWGTGSGTPQDGEAMPPQPQVEEMERGGPDFSETLAFGYDTQQRLTATTITRRQGALDCTGCSTQVIEELYDTITNQLQGGLTRTLNGVGVLETTHVPDGDAGDRRISATETASGGIHYTYDHVGNLTSVTAPDRDDLNLTYDGRRRLRTLAVGNRIDTYRYDLENRRISAEDAVHGEIVYAWQASRPLAIGFRGAGGHIYWTHAFGQGPTGLVFVKDLSQTGNDFFIFSDHLGTPFAYRQSGTNRVFYTPYNPWGELLARHPGGSPSYGDSGLQNSGFQLPPDSLFPTAPIGLSGHLYDYRSGLVYMHNRFYHPRLGHFLTPDFRVPDIYDPSTFTEPYAYAAGNPVIFFDPNGLEWVTVGEGQSLSDLAREYEVNLDWIIAANAPKDPNIINAGQLLWIPEVRQEGDELSQETVIERGDSAKLFRVQESLINGEYSFSKYESNVQKEYGLEELLNYINYVKSLNPDKFIPFLVRKSDILGNPSNAGFTAAKPGGSIRPGWHALGQDLGESQWISASERPNGAGGISGKPYYISQQALKNRGIEVIPNRLLIADVRNMIVDKVQPGSKNQILIERFRTWEGNQLNMESEALIRNRIPPEAVTSLRTMTYLRRGGHVLTAIGVVSSGVELKLAMDRAADRNSYDPIVGWSMRTAGSWGGAYMGAKAGFVAGAALGIETGPGLFATGIVGAIVFGGAGYMGADWVADYIDPN